MSSSKSEEANVEKTLSSSEEASKEVKTDQAEQEIDGDGNLPVQETATEPPATTIASSSTVPPSNLQDAPTIQPDEDANDADSSYGGDDNESDLNYGSITSSIYSYRRENGRTYHAYSDGKYLVPNDEREQERMDMAYHSLLLMFDGKAFFAPVENPQRILDVGTGTGIWALDVGDQYPSAQVIGIDLSPMQPKWVTPNVEFRVDDLEQPWVFTAPFDLVHSRLCGGNAIKNWPKYLADAYANLKPGGWVEGQEFYMDVFTDDNSLPTASKIKEWHDLSVHGAGLVGCPTRVDSQTMKRYFEEAGFINIHVTDYKWPISPWPADKRLKESGTFAMVSMLEELMGLSMAVFTRILGWSMEQLEVFLIDVKKEWKSKSIHAYWPIFVIYGQKPPSRSGDEAATA